MSEFIPGPPGISYEHLAVGEPNPCQVTAYQVNGICRTCNTVLPGTGLTPPQAVGHLKRHYRAHVKWGHKQVPGQQHWLQPELAEEDQA